LRIFAVCLSAHTEQRLHALEKPLCHAKPYRYTYCYRNASNLEWNKEAGTSRKPQLKSRNQPFWSKTNQSKCAPALPPLSQTLPADPNVIGNHILNGVQPSTHVCHLLQHLCSGKQRRKQHFLKAWSYHLRNIQPDNQQGNHCATSNWTTNGETS
jgi:hypothetical protein